MALYTLAQFAKTHGVSRQAVDQWKDAGHLDMRDDRVDADPTNARLKKLGLGRFSEKKKPSDSTRARAPAREVGSLEEAAEQIISASGAPHELGEAIRIKENYIALLRQLEYEQKNGSLIDMETASSAFFESARAARDAWLNWPAKFGPLIAAELDIEANRIVEILTSHVHQQIAELGEPEFNVVD